VALGGAIAAPLCKQPPGSAQWIFTNRDGEALSRMALLSASLWRLARLPNTVLHSRDVGLPAIPSAFLRHEPPQAGVALEVIAFGSATQADHGSRLR